MWAGAATPAREVRRRDNTEKELGGDGVSNDGVVFPLPGPTAHVVFSVLGTSLT